MALSYLPIKNLLSKNKDIIKFWVLYFLINSLLFLPRYLLEFDHSSFLPRTGFTGVSWNERYPLLFSRANYDVFRISIDWFLMVLIFLIIRSRIKVAYYNRYAAPLYIVLFFMLVYYNVLYRIYLIKPLIAFDLHLFLLAFRNTNFAGVLSGILILALLILLIFSLSQLLRTFFTIAKRSTIGLLTKGMLAFLGIFILLNTLRSGLTFYPYYTVQLNTALLVDNILLSIKESKTIHKIDFDKMNKTVHADSFKLAFKPDIYLIFIESYGNILNQDTNLKPRYLSCIEDCESRLKNEGWYMASGLSTSPISGGQSWLAYSSSIYGYKISNHGAYLLLQRNSEAIKYVNLFRYLQHQGYKSFWLNGLPENPKTEVPWDMYAKVFAVDEWIRFRDMNFEGFSYGFGPSPPDQFSIHFARQVMEKDKDKPRVLFYITQNSHNPFYCPDSVVHHWESLNTPYNGPEQKTAFLQKPAAENYIQSIEYELKMLTEFILSTPNKSSIFVLIGDHQPPVLTNAENGFETPIHIISGDEKWVESFGNYGFSNGLKSEMAKPIRHEAIFSLMLRELNRNYGVDTINLPAYYPNGLIQVLP